VTPKTTSLPNGWAELPVSDAVQNIPLTGKKLQASEYLEVGRLPVIDQGQSFVSGFTNLAELQVECNLPVIVFGDHTRVQNW
jgi:type I restriction enzyme S subunit